MVAAMGRTAADFFVHAPFEAVPVLGVADRAELLNYYNNGVTTGSPNSLGGKSYVDSSTPELLTVKLSEAAELAVAVLPNRGDTIVAFIETVATPNRDSNISFYRAADWSRRPDVALPGLDDFVPAAKRKAAVKADMPAIFLMSIAYDPAQQLFIMSNNSFDNLPRGNRPEAADILDSVQAYRYDGAKLVRVKNFKERVVLNKTAAQ